MVSVAKRIVAMIDRVTTTNSVAIVSIKDIWTIVVMDHCQVKAKYWKGVAM